MTDTAFAAPAATEAELSAVFEPVFARIAEGAVSRERDRRLPHEQIGWLREAGFGRLRLPREAGGFGATADQQAALLIGLGAADSNIVQALRGHIGFVEFVLAHPRAEFRDFWFAELAAGALVGNAESERTGPFARQATRVQREDGELVLDGTKYYTTGSIFADWILVSARVEESVLGEAGLVTVVVRADAPGVRIEDDWDGFGQRLTGSGTTVFTGVPVDPRFVTARSAEAAPGSVLHATYQLVHLSALAGIAEAALRDITEFVRSRSRNLFNPAVAPTEDPVSLQVLGEAFGAVKTVRASVLAAAASVEAASAAQLSGAGEAETAALLAAADAHVFGVQPTVIDLVLRTTGRIFEVGGASATSGSRALDRHWRNARTISSHNPAIYRQQAVGNHLVNGVSPAVSFLALLAAEPVT